MDADDNTAWTWLRLWITASVGQVISRLRPAYTPAQCNGGIGGTQTRHALQNLDRWLAEYPGRFVTLNYGSNHAGGGCDQACADAYETDMRTLIERLLLPLDLQVLNARVAVLHAAYPQVIHGPDLWTFFQNNPSLISSDDLHPTLEGSFRLKRLWADTMAGPSGPYGP